MSRLCCCVSTAPPPSALPPQAAAEEAESGGLGAVPSHEAPHPAGSAAGGAAELGQTDAQAAGGAGQGGVGADAPPAQRTAALEPAPAAQPEPEQEEDGAETLSVVCPEGLSAGDTLTVEVDGAEVEVVVPEGVAAGEEFDVRLGAEPEEQPPEEQPEEEQEHAELFAAAAGATFAAPAAPAPAPPALELSPAEPRDLLLLLKPQSDDAGGDDAPNATYLAVRQPKLPAEELKTVVSKRTKLTGRVLGGSWTTRSSSSWTR